MRERTAVPNDARNTTSAATAPGLDERSYKIGMADGRVQAIEESMDVVAVLIMKAEAMITALPPDTDQVARERAGDTVRALKLAFAAVAGAESGSAAFQSLLEESRTRLNSGGSTMH